MGEVWEELFRCFRGNAQEKRIGAEVQVAGPFQHPPVGTDESSFKDMIIIPCLKNPFADQWGKINVPFRPVVKAEPDAVAIEDLEGGNSFHDGIADKTSGQ